MRDSRSSVTVSQRSIPARYIIPARRKETERSIIIFSARPKKDKPTNYNIPTLSRTHIHTHTGEDV